ncbi:MAG: glycosyltransferase family 2 protein [Candidatus Thiothrix sulfatifontis]|nr:MAG: glycosyltransferase family 2 protein [Candidatus Thiothrix sulfatifontis]
MLASTPASIVAIVVTHFPDVEMLGEQLTRLVPQVAAVVLVDNGSNIDILAWNAERKLKAMSAASEVIPLGINKGIATAQNIGIRWAQQQQVTCVLFMDQDSVPAADMVVHLFAALVKLPAVAAVGPRYWDERQASRQQNLASFIRRDGLKLKRYACDSEGGIIPVSYLVSSGCLIPLSVLEKVGGMRDELFIDYVDFEWGLRAAHHGLCSYGVCAAHLHHQLGDSHLKVFNRNIPLHSPLRHYYLCRNAVLLYKMAWIPYQWKVADGARLLLKCGIYIVFAPQRLAHWRMMALGVWHGLRGRFGQLTANTL